MCEIVHWSLSAEIPTLICFPNKHKICVLIIKPTRCTNFSNLFLELNSTYFGQFLCPSSGVFHCTHDNGKCHIACEQDQDGSVLILLASCQHTCMTLEFLCLQWKTPDDGQRNCPIHVEFYSKNKFEKLVHLVDFIISIYYDAWSPECQMLVCVCGICGVCVCVCVCVCGICVVCVCVCVRAYEWQYMHSIN